MLQRVLYVAIIVFSAIVSNAQTGTLKGNIKDGSTNEPIIAANVVIKGTSQGVAADLNGDFMISKVKAGTYDLIISFISYRSDTLKGITVYPDQTTVINHSLLEEVQQIAEVVVTGARVVDNDIAVITEIKKSDLVAVGISAQQITMSQDRDAAQVMKRIPGVTILNNRFVNVRGLSERYSTVLLNGVIAPSTEVDSRAFAFDLIPSSMIDRMLVYKSGSAELPGEFAGSVINIGTKSVIDENSLSINITGGYRVGTTGKDFYKEEGSNTDALGFDNGLRALPSSFPERNLRTLTQDLSNYNNRKLVTEAGAGLPNSWSPLLSTAAPDLRTTINFSKSAYIGENVKLGNITSLSYSNTRQHIAQDNYYYEAYDPATNAKVGRRYVFNDDRDSQNARIGLISNFILELNPSNKIEFRNLLNQQGNSQVTMRTGLEDVQNNEIKNLALNYYERAMYSGQLQGKHGLTDRLNLGWVLGYSTVSADQPDYRRIRSQRSIGSTDPFSVVIPPGASSFDAGRFYSELTENVYTHALNFDFKLNPEKEEEQQGKISAGYYLAKTERDFDARWFSYRWASNPSFEVIQRPFGEIFTRPNLINEEDAAATPRLPLFIIEEGTNFSDKYTGENLLGAGYVGATIPINNFRLAIGSRVEYNNQELLSYDNIGGELKVENPVTSILPFMNLAYNLNEKNLFRVAYSKTVNRPIFREVAPFNYYDFDRNANFIGEPSLTIADIHNVDFRWERYPSKAENISFGVFYKYFQNPIETRLLQGSNLIYSFINAESATSYGAEIEMRKSLDGLTNSSFIDKFTVLFNSALIKSNVKLPAEADNQEKDRAMQGQSPYVVNASLMYNDLESGWQWNIAYNIFGRRIYAIGDYNQQSGFAQNPTQYEMPRHQLDFTVSKELRPHFEVKFGIQDVLNQKYRLMQDSDSDKEISDFDDAIQTFKPGQYVTLGVTYKL
jgi:TonB-dependent receptor